MEREILKKRRPSSDRGSQYASHEYQQTLSKHGLISSMSRSGNCWDNAVAESFFATLKLNSRIRRAGVRAPRRLYGGIRTEAGITQFTYSSNTRLQAINASFSFFDER
jgi:transposase InsO family protein